MNTIFENTKKRVIEKISVVDKYTGEVFENHYANQLHHEFKIVPPALDKKNTKTSIKSEVISIHNAPPGVSFVPGEPMDYALIAVPVLNPGNLIGDLLPGFQGKVSWGNNGGKLFITYKEFKKNLQGDEPALEQVRNNAKAIFESIEGILSSFRDEAENFNENVLRPLIREQIEKEQNIRNLKKSSEKKLNPFE